MVIDVGATHGRNRAMTIPLKTAKAINYLKMDAATRRLAEPYLLNDALIQHG
jgi:hypothetical protein